MYSETDLDGAVAAGAISAEAAEALRAHAASQRNSPVADEEQFRLITGFNDIFVTIACALVIFASAAVGGEVATWLGAALVALASWLMAEMFTRRRRMALPSIVLLIAFSVALGMTAAILFWPLFPSHLEWHTYTPEPGKAETYSSTEWYPWQTAAIAAIGGLAAALGALLHWFRFKVAITIAAGIAALVVLLLALVAAATGQEIESNRLIAPAAFICGLAVFGYAMKWDLTDPARKTQNADIAFWLHLLAAPLIAHPLFYWMGVTGGQAISSLTALGVLAIYLVFGVVALAVDRRALLVSALAYVLIALGQLFRSYGAVQLNVALTALVIGSALLVLSAFWAPIRRTVVARLPEGLRAILPATAVVAA
jgi:MFS family permease